MTSVTVIDGMGRRVFFESAPGERILHSGLLVGIDLPHECASGTCGSCKARCEAGAVDDLWPLAPGKRLLRRPDELLMCQTRCAGTEPVRLSIRGKLPERAARPVAERVGRLRRVELLTPDIAFFDIDLDRPLSYAPGQFVLVEFEEFAGPRAYSMSRGDDGSANLGLLIRRQEDGEASRRLFAPLFRSCQVSVFGPLGRASFSPDEDRPFIAMAGGSGIAGMLAILEAAAASDQFARHRNALVFGLRDPSAAYLLDQLDAAAADAGDGLSITVAFSHADPGAALGARYPHLRLASGFVHDATAALPDGLIGGKAVHFVAGPPPMVDATLRWLVLDRKVSPTEVRYDRFG